MYQSGRPAIAGDLDRRVSETVGSVAGRAAHEELLATSGDVRRRITSDETESEKNRGA
jgi:hypothetical protein